MRKIILSIFVLAILALSLSFSSALCLNCNQLNKQVTYYQNANGCDIYSPTIQENFVYNQKPIYSLAPSIPRNPQVVYYQTISNYKVSGCKDRCYAEYEPVQEQKKTCNWHFSFFRSDCN